MAAPTLTIRKLAESEELVLLEGLISSGGTTEMAATKFADMSEYTIGGNPVSLSINKVEWSLENMNVKLLFDANTDDEGITLSGIGKYDFSKIGGIKNPKSTGYTGDIMLATYGVLINAAEDTVGSIILECKKLKY
jgi:hypothetical protein